MSNVKYKYFLVFKHKISTPSEIVKDKYIELNCNWMVNLYIIII